LSSFLESPQFPIQEINQYSAGEKRGGGRPDFWEMVFWWTRKPLIGARSVIAGALLPSSFSPHEFKRLVGLWPESKTPHKKNPKVIPQLKERFSKVKLLDPFAGFGSIPLEAMRLGIGEVVAVELLPTAYVFLKAVLEYPKEFGERLVKDVERWGRWVTDKLREDPDVRELYDEDVAVYIGTWEVKCPHCGRYTPLVGNWWLARVSRKGEEDEEEEGEEEGVKSGTFRRLAWMVPYASSSAVGVRIVDLNRELNVKEVKARINLRQGKVEVYGRTYNVPRPNVEAKRKIATCLLCNNAIKKNGDEWYVKESLKEYNENLERYLRGEIVLEDLLKSRARPRILARVKVINDDLEFEPATSEDDEKLWRALEKLRRMWGDPDIPTELTSPYENKRITPILGANKWYQFFNPRQLLILVKLVKLIREAGKQVEQEKIKEELSKEEAFRYAEAIATYLAATLIKQADFNSIVKAWEPSTGYGSSLALLHAGHTLSFRGIAIVWNFVEYNFTLARVGWAKFLSLTSEGLNYLISAVSSSSSSSSKIKVLLDDATILNMVGDKGFDLIVTDPPYRDDVPYAELSDFYYVWLKRALSDVKESFGIMKLVPRFHEEAFFDNLGNEVETQWKAFALREVSENEGRVQYFGVNTGALDHFKSLLSESFKTMASRLKDDGLLVTYYAHTSPDAWEALLEAGWLNTKMRITAAHAIVTESAESVVARGKIRLDMAIVAVWRKGVKGEALIDEVYARAVEACSKDANEYRKAGLEGVNLFVAVLGKVLSHFTQYERLIGLKATDKAFVRDLVENYVYPATVEAIARSYGAVGARLSPTPMFYLLSKVLIGRRPRQSRRTLDRTAAIMLSIGTRSDLKDLEDQKVIRRAKEYYVLLEPKWGANDPKDAIGDALTARGLNPRELRMETAVDALHLLEFYAATLPREEFKRRAEEIRGREPRLFDEAVVLARVLASSLPAEDPERELAKQVMEALGLATPGTLEPFLHEVRSDADR
jgi:putative DNA methylase